jgi:hypothetical protein
LGTFTRLLGCASLITFLHQPEVSRAWTQSNAKRVKPQVNRFYIRHYILTKEKEFTAKLIAMNHYIYWFCSLSTEKTL